MQEEEKNISVAECLPDTKDEQFLTTIRKIVEKKKSQSSQLFSEQTLQFTSEDYEIINELSTSHAKAHILNNTSSKQFNSIKQQQKCRCGCGKGFGSWLPLSFNQQKLSFLGTGVILFFFYLRYMRLMLLFVFFLFSTFCIISNILAYQSEHQCYTKSQFIAQIVCVFYQISTFRSVASNTTLIKVQLWLGFCSCLFWVIGVRFITNLGRKKDKEIDDTLVSGSDFAIRIQNLPFGEYSEYELLDYLNQLAVEKQIPLKICSLQVIYNMDECRKLLKQIQMLSQNFLNKFEGNYSDSVIVYKMRQFPLQKEKLKQKLTKLENLRTQFKLNQMHRTHGATTLAIALFPSSPLMHNFLNAAESIQNPLEQTFMPDNSMLFKGKRLIIKRAPQPSDIMWGNCEKDVSGFRSLIIWAAVMFVLYVGYAAISYSQTLSFVQDSAGFIVAAVLQLFNRLIFLILSYLVTFQYNNTKTEAIISLMKKSVLAQTINIIVTPMVSKFINERDLYGNSGVSTMAVNYQIAMMAMMFLYYIFNPLQLGKMFMLKIPCLRNWIIRTNCQRVGQIKDMDLSKIFIAYEGPDFPTAGAYVYMTTAIFHGMFYCHLQPIVILLVVINMSIFMFIMKYMLYRRYRIPELTDVQVFQLAMFVINWAALFYAAGNIFFLIIDDQIFQQSSYLLFLPSVLIILIWFVSNLNLWDLFNKIDNLILKLLERAHEEKKGVKKSPFRGTIHVDRLSEQMSHQENITIWNRQESYFINSNTNLLFDYQLELFDYSTKNPKRGHNLKQYCNNFNTIETLNVNPNLLAMPKVEPLIQEFSTNYLQLKYMRQKLTSKISLIPVILVEKESSKQVENSKQ